MATEGILIINSEINAGLHIKAYLKSMGHTKILLAENLQDGKRILSERGEEIFLVLLGLVFADGYGLSLMESLVHSHPYIIGIIVITADADPEVEKYFYQLATERIVAAGYQLQPINITELSDLVKSTLELIATKRSTQSTLAQDQGGV